MTSISTIEHGKSVELFVATGQNFPDALTAAAAVRGTAPVLLVGHDHVPDDTARALRTFRPDHIVIVGGVNAVSEHVARSLRPFAAQSVDRVGGRDRYATSAELSRREFAEGADVAYIATGQTFPDALTAAAAARTNAPVLLVHDRGIPEDVATELDRLGVDRIIVVGGESSIPLSVAAALGRHTSGPIIRISGHDRYATAAALAEATFAEGAASAFVARGDDFADALIAAAATRGEAPVLLSRASCLSEASDDEIDRLRSGRLVLVGGERALSPAVGNRVRCSVG